MQRNETDILWQRLLDEEKQHLSTLPPAELLALEYCTSKTIDGEIQIQYSLWHENPDEWCGLEFHSFILLAERKLPPFGIFYRKYLAGFSLDSTGMVIPISDETLYKYD